MKIIRLTTLLDFGGQERQYISFVEDRMSDIENEYIFAAIGHGGYAENYIREKGFKVKIFNSKPNISNIINIWILYKWFLETKPDIVHTAAAEANFHGVIAAKLARIKVVIAEEIGMPNHSNKAKLIFLKKLPSSPYFLNSRVRARRNPPTCVPPSRVLMLLTNEIRFSEYEVL